MRKTLYIIRYGEIGLKGQNRPSFEKALLTNINLHLPNHASLIRQHGQLLLTCDSTHTRQITQLLKKTFGIVWFAQAHQVSRNLDNLTLAVVAHAKTILKKDTSFAVRVSRRFKDYPHTSLELERRLGKSIQLETNSPVNLSHPHHTINVIIDHQTAYIHSTKTPGPGGLPVGTSGRALSLISGGFDSIASSYLMAKRGANIDFLHFHIFADHHQVDHTKIPAIINSLAPYTQSRRLYLASYLPFQMKTLNLPAKFQKYELIVFRRLMHTVGESLAQKFNYQALVTGDSLAQVASQTMENLTAVDHRVRLPIFRPLIGFDKTEIINLVNSLGLHSHATAPYQDCCSLVASHPATRANFDTIKQLEDLIGIDTIVKQIVADTHPLN